MKINFKESNMFEVGQKVVCMNTDPDLFMIPRITYVTKTLDPLVAGKIYTVREVFICPVHDVPHLKLVEIVRACAPHFPGVEYGYDARRFNPIIDKKTDISLFKVMLNSQKTSVVTEKEIENV